MYLYKMLNQALLTYQPLGRHINMILGLVNRDEDSEYFNKRPTKGAAEAIHMSLHFSIPVGSSGLLDNCTDGI